MDERSAGAPESRQPEVYVRESDGTLAPIEIPKGIAVDAEVYLWLRRRGLQRDEIQLILEMSPLGRPRLR